MSPEVSSVSHCRPVVCPVAGAPNQHQQRPRLNPACCVQKLYEQQIAMQSEGQEFLPPEHPAVRSCKDTLAWWQPGG